jgi:hypothetical protein
MLMQTVLKHMIFIGRRSVALAGLLYCGVSYLTWWSRDQAEDSLADPMGPRFQPHVLPPLTFIAAPVLWQPRL